MWLDQLERLTLVVVAEDQELLVLVVQVVLVVQELSLIHI